MTFLLIHSYSRSRFVYILSFLLSCRVIWHSLVDSFSTSTYKHSSPEILTNLWLIDNEFEPLLILHIHWRHFRPISIHSKCLCWCVFIIRCTLAQDMLLFFRVSIYLVFIYILNQLLVDAVGFSCLQHHRCFYDFSSKVSCCCLFCVGIFIVYIKIKTTKCAKYICIQRN